MIELTDIAYVRSGTADPEEAVRFSTEVVGLQYVGAEDGVHYLRADHRHHCLAFVEGAAGVISSGFAVADDVALDRAEEELIVAGVPVQWGTAAEARSRRVGRFLTFTDPGGNRIDLVSRQVNDSRPVQFSRTAGIVEFGHLCVDAPDVPAAVRWWGSLFNTKVSDWVGDGCALLRIDEVHHKFAVLQGDRPGLCHINFLVETIDDVMRSWHVIQRAGVEIVMGPGRHPTSGGVFLYFKGPEGLTYEYAFGARLIRDEDKWVARYFDPAETTSMDMWGGAIQRPTTQHQDERASVAAARLPRRA